MAKIGEKELQSRALKARLADRREVVPHTPVTTIPVRRAEHKARPSATLSEPGAQRPKKQSRTATGNGATAPTLRKRSKYAPTPAEVALALKDRALVERAVWAYLTHRNHAAATMQASRERRSTVA